MKTLSVYVFVFTLLAVACYVFASRARAEPDEQDENSIPLGVTGESDVFDDLPDPLVKKPKAKKPVVKSTASKKLLPFCDKNAQHLCVPVTQSACFCRADK